MQGKIKILAAIGVFLLISLYFATKSEAFNTFRSANDDSKTYTESNESAAAMRELRDINLQILEQLKIMNQNLSRGGGMPQNTMQNNQSQNAPSIPGVNTPPSIMRANP